MGLAVLSLLLAGSFGLTWWRLDAAMRRVNGVLQVDHPDVVGVARRRGAENVLVIGVESRAGGSAGTRGAGTGGAGTSRAGTSGVEGARPDTTVLVHVPADRASVTAVSIPGNAWVEVPACPRQGGGWTTPYTGALDSALSTGGPACAVRTVQKLTGVVVTRYVQLDVHALGAVVDALGGVEIDYDGVWPAPDPDSGLALRPGRNELDGERALAYVREWRGPGGAVDSHRVRRQQELVRAVARKARDDAPLDPVRLRRVVSDVLASSTVDERASLVDLEGLVATLRSVPPERFVLLAAPIASIGTGTSTGPDHGSDPGSEGGLRQGGDRVLLDVEAGRRLYRALAADAPLPG